MDTTFNPNDYPTYQIGDRVTIRQWDDMESKFGLNRFGDIKVPKACFTESSIHPRRPIFHQLVPCFILNLFFTIRKDQPL